MRPSALRALIIAGLIGACMGLAGAADSDDTMAGAKPFDVFGCGRLQGQKGDVDWWRLRRGHAANVTLYVESGYGCLCSCPKGDAALFALDVYDAAGALLLSHVAAGPGLAIIPLPPLPLGQPVFLRLSGMPIGPTGSAPYRLFAF